MHDELTEAMKHLQACRKEYGPDDPRTHAAFEARVAEMESETKPMPGIWYMSFANETAFVGGLFLFATSTHDAVKRSHAMGQNPGGAVVSCPPNEGTALIPERFINRLMSRADLEEMDLQMQAENN